MRRLQARSSVHIGSMLVRFRQAFTRHPGPGGSGYCAAGVLDGSEVCCAASCGTCGGPGCSARSGGAEGCCWGTITEAGRTCSAPGDTACLMPPGTPRFPVGSELLLSDGNHGKKKAKRYVFAGIT